jgi:hypothetical protein
VWQQHSLLEDEWYDGTTEQRGHAIVHMAVDCSRSLN